MTNKSNKHIWDYLAFYLGLGHAPGFAVLVSGPWGIGKTYLLKAFLKRQFGDETAKYVYVSLYGLSTIEEIDDALFQSAFPALTGTAAKVAGRVAKAGLKFLKVDPGDWNIKEFFNKFDAKVYVFDDLERCEAPINKVLGYINQFVEHGAAKVIVLANEKEIGPDEDYTRRREKLIGKTLQVASVFDEAFEHFASYVDHEGARAFIRDVAVAADIKTIYDQSELNNLRILQQTMWDFERFYAALSPQHQANKEAMATLLRLLFVLSFEFKAGRVSEEDMVTGRGMNARMLAAFDKDKPKSPIALAGDRYPMVDIDDNTLSNELLVDYLVRGVVDPDAIRSELSASRFFITVANEPSWQTIWNWFDRSDAEFHAALAKMDKQFGERAFTRTGEILHVLGLRLFLSDREVLPFSRAEVVSEGKAYIDDLYAAKRLELPPAGDFSEVRFQGWGGLGIYEHETPEYKKLFEYLSTTMQRSVEDTYPAKAIQLLAEMRSDVDSFYRKLSLSHADTSQYVRVPVLSKMPIADFVNAFLDLHPSAQRIAMMALKGRYQYGRLEQELKEEKPWIASVHDVLMKRLPELSTISQHRLQQHLEWYRQSVQPQEPSEAADEQTDVVS
ncbi:P-loop NTPase fold protein [Bradyrhizobium sp. SZCCHNR1045]|uniref:P-loop NTPase fold protein n=1 Tax=Bradyrhizobium sp. SZCCHNR1045 TaxID=3057353 RepID=UPI0029161161|nr:P-loop NTPase fold protein [Bradyrhizobium sp. SZCCHNR1045]